MAEIKRTAGISFIIQGIFEWRLRMAPEQKMIKNVTINYENGTRNNMQYYALVGFSEGTWHSVMLSPADMSAKIRMNNLIAALCNDLVDAINREQEENLEK
jgi:hypothetical protein